jgi:tetratricopeptide (TPR) repeat protein
MSVLRFILAAFGLVASGLTSASHAQPAVTNPPPFVFPANLGRVDFEVPEMPQPPLAELQQTLTALRDNEAASFADWETLAVQLFMIEAFPEALEAADRAFALEPEGSPGLWTITAFTAEALGDYERTLAIWQRELQQDPNSEQAPFRIGLSLLGLQQGPDAVAFLRRHLVRRPTDVLSAHLLAALQWQIGQPREAWRTLARAAGRVPLRPASYLFLAWLSLNRDDPYESVGWLRQALADLDDQRRQQWISLAAFEPLADHPAFTTLCAELNLQPDAAWSGSMDLAAAERQPVVVIYGIRREQVLPESLQVGLALNQTGMDGGSGLWNPDTGEAGLRLQIQPEPQPLDRLTLR